MDVHAKSEINTIKERLLPLVQNGQYGQAVQLINSIMLYSDDLKDEIKRALREKENEDAAAEAVGSCCGSCCSSDCGSAYCVGFVITFLCCGEDVASSCCGCDWMVDSSSSCVRDQCC